MIDHIYTSDENIQVCIQLLLGTTALDEIGTHQFSLVFHGIWAVALSVRQVAWQLGRSKVCQEPRA
eukprot:2923189-Amphidinium_carterae.1